MMQQQGMMQQGMCNPQCAVQPHAIIDIFQCVVSGMRMLTASDSSAR